MFTVNATRLSILAIAAQLSACGGGGSSGPNLSQPSTGLRIFVTSRVHNGDFRDDVVLTGATAMQKADNFCQTDTARPASGTYKALLVDGVTRDAASQIDWVLKANTVYFQPLNNVRIGVTTPAAVFPTASNHLEHNIHDNFGTSNDPNNPAPTSLVWTGLAEASTFAASPDNCLAWSNSLNPNYSTVGVTYGTDATAFYTNGGHSCTLEHRLYCVEQ